MKFGIRTLSVKKSFKAKTTGKLKRSLKKSVNPLYGKKGMGYINNPKRAIYNKIYHQTSVSMKDVILTNHTKTKSNHSQASKPVITKMNATDYLKIKKNYQRKKYLLLVILITIILCFFNILFLLILFCETLILLINVIYATIISHQIGITNYNQAIKKIKLTKKSWGIKTKHNL